MTSRSAALIGLLFLMPFFVLNSIVGTRTQPFYSWFELSVDRLGANPLGLAVLGIALLMLLAGSVINLRRCLQPGSNGRRRVHVPNVLVGVVSFLILFVFVGAMAEEFYRCEVLAIPNCD